MGENTYPNAPGFVAGDAESKAAADFVELRVGPMHRKVIGLLEERGAHGATDEEIQIELGLRPNTARPRRRELELAGRVVASGKRRKNLSGCSARVWVLAILPQQQELL